MTLVISQRHSAEKSDTPHGRLRRRGCTPTPGVAPEAFPVRSAQPVDAGGSEAAPGTGPASAVA
jgi:hypothetical protein